MPLTLDALLVGLLVTAVITSNGTLGFTITGVAGLTLKWTAVARCHQSDLT